METETLWFKIGESFEIAENSYTIWRSATMPTFYQITVGERPKDGDGYSRLDDAMKARGLRLTEDKGR